MRRLLRVAALVGALASGAAIAGGPMIACGGVGTKYPGAGNVTLRYDQGSLGSRSKAQADTIVNNAIALWTNVGTATITLSRGADLPVDVTTANVASYLNNSSDGINPVVYDTNGTITDLIFGVGAKDSVLGFAGSASSGCSFVEGRAVINGFIPVLDSVMTVVIAHEIGHLIGLDHTQLDASQGLADSNYPLMYPIAYRTTATLHEDDIASVSALYPDATVNTTYGQVSGNFLNGATALRGANLWAREVNTNKVYSIVSDYLMGINGFFKFLLPPGTYRLAAEAVDKQFTEGSSVGPYAETTNGLSFLAPFYNGATPMSPVTFGNANPTLITVTAGCAATVTFQLNGTGSVGGNCGPTFALTVNKAGIGQGNVLSSPDGIGCGPFCSASFLGGTNVTLTATPIVGSVFSGWSGACGGTGTCSVNMNAAKSVTATFSLADDYSDNMGSAFGAGAVSTTAGTLNSASDADWFRFDFAEAGRWTVYTMGTTNTAGSAWSPDGVTMYGQDDNSRDGTNFLLTFQIGGATSVYVKVTGAGGAMGPYSLVSEFIPGALPNAPQDVNRDGKSDIVWRNSSTGQVYRMLMSGMQITAAGLAYTEPDVAWKIVADGDVNGDGASDLVWRNSTTGQVSVQFYGPSGVPTSGAAVHTEPNPAWKIIATPDLDGNGKADLLWWNSSTGQVYAMLMNGGAVGVQGFVYTEPNTAWKIVATGDFAGSGKKNQLLWRNSTTGQVFLMTVTVVGGVFVQTGTMIYQEPNTAWKIIGAADFNGDGRSDILWRNDATGQVYLMLMNGGSIVAQAMVHTEPNLAWKIVANGDYNGDGKADLLWKNDSTGQVYMMIMNGLFVTSQGMVHQEPNSAWRILGPLEYSGG